MREDNLVGGFWKESTNTSKVETSLGIFTDASPEQIDKALFSAKTANEAMASSSLKERQILLQYIIEELEKNKTNILTAYQTESKLPLGRAEGEFGRTLGQIQQFIALLEEGRFLQAELTTDSTNTPDLRRMMHPLGPVVVFGASNFPLAFSTAGGDTISAFAAGCPVIVKAHPYHPETSRLVATALHNAIAKTDLPLGIFSHLNGVSHSVGATLVSHPATQAVGFTGSFMGGKALMDLAQKREVSIPVFAEMGSVNPVIVLENKLLDPELPVALADSIALGSGQFCTNPGLIFLLGDKKNQAAFIAALSSVLLEKDSQPMVHPNIESHYRKALNALSSKALHISQTAQTALGVVTATDFLEDSTLEEEIFGPYSLVVQCNTITELELILNQLKGQLTLSLHAAAADEDQAKKLLPLVRAKAGRLLFSGVPTGVAVHSSMQHGGPYPASSDSRYTAVGTNAIARWLRPVCYQDCPEALLPPALQKSNPQHITRTENGILTIVK